MTPYIQASTFLKNQLAQHNFKPRVGLILGSGLGEMADHIDAVASFDYKDIPGFPHSTVAGHQGSLVCGYLHKIPVLCMKGRVHFYEGHSGEALRTPVYTMKLLGCETLLATNAAGSLKKEAGPGSIFVITDHISFFGTNPLLGKNDEAMGPRFVPMRDAYDPDLRRALQDIAIQENIKLFEGVYIGFSGPVFETPAEIRMARVWGADVVGMSLVPEVIVARHCGMKVLGVSVITNLAEGMGDIALSHDQTLHYASIGGQELQKLLLAFFASGSF